MGSPTLDIHLHKHNKVQKLLPSRKGVATYIDRDISTNQNKNRSITNSTQKKNTKRVQIKNNSIRQDKNKGTSESDSLLPSPNAKDMTTDDGTNPSAVQLESSARPLHNPPGPLHNPPGPPSHGTISTKSAEININTQTITGFSYFDLLEDADGNDSIENSFGSPSSPTPNEKGIWGPRPKLDLNVLTAKDMALITVTAFGCEDITDYLHEVYLLAQLEG